MKQDGIGNLRAELEEANDRIAQLERALADKIIQQGRRKINIEKRAITRASLHELRRLHEVCHNNLEDELTLNLIQAAIDNIESLAEED